MKEFKRQDIFTKFKKIRTLISDFQNSFFDEDFDSKDDEMFDALLFEHEIETENFVVIVPSKNLDEHAEKLTEILKKLLKHLKVENLLVISHLKLDFFGNLDNDYQKVVESYEKLNEYFPAKTFKEAFEIKCNEIDDFVSIFFWLERCDPSIPEYVFWFDTDERFCFFFNKYGNVHFIDLTNGKLINDNDLEKLGFKIGNYDQFNQNAIEGRQIKI